MKTLFIASALATTTVWFLPIRSSSLPVCRSVRQGPVLIRIDSKAGHGGGKPLSKVMEETADIYGFIMYNMGMKMK